jgi:hypothetical protein
MGSLRRRRPSLKEARRGSSPPPSPTPRCRRSPRFRCEPACPDISSDRGFPRLGRGTGSSPASRPLGPRSPAAASARRPDLAYPHERCTQAPCGERTWMTLRTSTHAFSAIGLRCRDPTPRKSTSSHCCNGGALTHELTVCDSYPRTLSPRLRATGSAGVVRVQRDLDLAHAGLGLRIPSLNRSRLRSTWATRKSISSTASRPLGSPIACCSIRAKTGFGLSTRTVYPRSSRRQRRFCGNRMREHRPCVDYPAVEDNPSEFTISNLSRTQGSLNMPTSQDAVPAGGSWPIMPRRRGSVSPGPGADRHRGRPSRR